MAKLNPGSVYKNPRDILTDETITKSQKIDILERWAYDERELSVAEEENMLSADDQQNNNILDEIYKCLLELGIDETKLPHPPTKQG